MAHLDMSQLPPRYQRQVLDQLMEQKIAGAIAEVERKNKYKNQPDTRGDLKFDSRKEARRFDELALLEQAGEVRRLKLQSDFTLQEAFTTPSGKRVRAIRYRADFDYEKKADAPGGGVVWVRVVEDVKSRGTRTREYLTKAKLMQEIYGISIQEV